LVVEAIDRDTADLDTPVRCGHSHQGAFVGAGGRPPRGHRRILGILVLDLEMQIRDRGTKGFDELARPVKTAAACLRDSIVSWYSGENSSSITDRSPRFQPRS
jgi:hypothetical protein